MSATVFSGVAGNLAGVSPESLKRILFGLATEDAIYGVPVES